jgi:hypothetical protein
VEVHEDGTWLLRGRSVDVKAVAATMLTVGDVLDTSNPADAPCERSQDGQHRLPGRPRAKDCGGHLGDPGMTERMGELAGRGESPSEDHHEPRDCQDREGQRDQATDGHQGAIVPGEDRRDRKPDDQVPRELVDGDAKPEARPREKGRPPRRGERKEGWQCREEHRYEIAVDHDLPFREQARLLYEHLNNKCCSRAISGDKVRL